MGASRLLPLGLALLAVLLVLYLSHRVFSSAPSEAQGRAGARATATAASASGAAVPAANARFLLVRNYNYAAGFFWCIYNVLCASHAARKHGLQLLVVFDSGLYLESEPRYRRQYSEAVETTALSRAGLNSWFHYYFEPLGERDAALQQLYRDAASGRSSSARGAAHANPFARIESFADWEALKRDPGARVFEFDRRAYDTRDMAVDYHREIGQCLALRPHMRRLVDDFYARHALQDKYLVGIHVRGSDKMDGKNSPEDGPKHYTYRQYCDLVERLIAQTYYRNPHLQRKKVAVFACSDEQPFIDYIHAQLGARYEVLSCPDVIRSDVNTSGLDLRSHECDDADQSENCRRYRQLAEQSVHRGHRHLCNYKKGQDIVWEVMLLARCDVFLRSRGNVSNFPAYINPKLLVIDMVDTLR